MSILLALFSIVLTFFVVLLLSIFFEKLLTRMGLMVPDAHKPDKKMVPRPGGPAIYIGIIIVIFIVVRNITVIALVASASIALLAGLFDDFFRFGGIEKPVLTAIAAAPFIILGTYNPNPYVPFVGTVTIKILYPLLLIAGFSIYSNATNMLDIYNGLLTGSMILATVPLSFYFYIRGEYQILLISLIFIAGLSGFLVRHAYPSKLFPGDSGTLFIGAFYFALMVLGRAEIIGVIATLPLIFNGFFILTSIRGFKEHSKVQRPVIITNEGKILAVKGRGVPITLARLFASEGAVTEKEIINGVWLMFAVSALLSIFTALVFFK
ncbi:MAG: hypothetical protein JRN10_08050 [Nitrososphaerota archaeon]|nr:hypothetical protein [Nitrososphaerota archaeon]MDG6931169.1 hypothetical protein [Nitrososphaerota archaeon]